MQNRGAAIVSDDEHMAYPRVATDGRWHFAVQWHITDACDQGCRHCYNADRGGPELSYDECTAIIDDIAQTLGGWNMPAWLSITGGDPLLRADVFDLIAYARQSGLGVGILGNPNHLTHETAERLRCAGVMQYQLSLDGNAPTHDRLRNSPGLHHRTIEALRVLAEVGIPSTVMFTVSAVNAAELCSVIDLAASLEVGVFDFSRLVPIGTGEAMRESVLSATEYRKLLLAVHAKYCELESAGCRTQFGRKEHLWKLLYSELGLDVPAAGGATLVDGCSIGYGVLTILPDGRVLSCRRLPLQIGVFPDDSFRHVLLESPAHAEMRDVSRFAKCSRCDLVGCCRGCPAVAYAVHGAYGAPDPQCWRKV